MKISELFGENVFTKAVMRERLPREVYQEVVNVEQNGGQISMAAADVVAKADGNRKAAASASTSSQAVRPGSCLLEIILVPSRFMRGNRRCS